MTINTVSSSNAATAVHAQQAAKRKPSTVDFAKVMAGASGDIKTDTNTATKQSNPASPTAIVQNTDGSKVNG